MKDLLGRIERLKAKAGRGTEIAALVVRFVSPGEKLGELQGLKQDETHYTRKVSESEKAFIDRATREARTTAP